MKRRESVWLLNYLLNNKDLLGKVSFVEEAHYCPIGIVISATTSNSVPFRFYKGNLMTSNADIALNSLRGISDDVHIQVNFHNQSNCTEYMKVLEDNPFRPSHLYRTISEYGTTYIQETTTLAKIIGEEKVSEELLLKDIDYALETGNKTEFIKLTNKLQGRGN